jgi:hypothetical protein
MTVISLRRFAARPLRRAAVPRWLRIADRPPRPGRRPYYDPFFADPAAVEDDYRRMTRIPDRLGRRTREFL